MSRDADEVNEAIAGELRLTYETAFGGRHARRSSLWRRRAEGPDGRRLYYHQATPVPGRSA
ncbi:hypothetical protein [Streptomyces olivochromogenes]|uniref:hypothetical protein n=1 Tax=Streptomyces olivochromogenes TaxID=1963 RepID=UPI0035AFD83B